MRCSPGRKPRQRACPLDCASSQVVWAERDPRALWWNATSGRSGGTRPPGALVERDLRVLWWNATSGRVSGGVSTGSTCRFRWPASSWEPNEACPEVTLHRCFLPHILPVACRASCLARNCSTEEQRAGRPAAGFRKPRRRLAGDGGASVPPGRTILRQRKVILRCCRVSPWSCSGSPTDGRIADPVPRETLCLRMASLSCRRKSLPGRGTSPMPCRGTLRRRRMILQRRRTTLYARQDTLRARKVILRRRRDLLHNDRDRLHDDRDALQRQKTRKTILRSAESSAAAQNDPAQGAFSRKTGGRLRSVDYSKESRGVGALPADDLPNPSALAARPPLRT